jgi:hypothetical protein
MAEMRRSGATHFLRRIDASDVLLMLMLPGGLTITGWLLVKGVNLPKWNAMALGNEQ